MTDKLKKQIILNLPYLIFVYLFDKLCQGVRLSPGADASEKLLHIGQGFSAAFASLAPSFHLLDLCVGAAGAVLIRLAVYSKGKNAKKYRRGIEYGSARWGTPADIAPYADPDFFQNVLLTQTERITMSSRPKEPKYARNKNILVIGGSGSGKTRLKEMGSSFPGAWGIWCPRWTQPGTTLVIRNGSMMTFPSCRSPSAMCWRRARRTPSRT